MLLAMFYLVVRMIIYDGAKGWTQSVNMKYNQLKNGSVF